MKRAVVGALVMLLFGLLAYAAPAQYNAPPFPKTLINAKYVYVTSYDGDQFDQTFCRRIVKRSPQCRMQFRNGVIT